MERESAGARMDFALEFATELFFRLDPILIDRRHLPATTARQPGNGYLALAAILVQRVLRELS